MDKEKHMHVEIENLAVPEVHFEEEGVNAEEAINEEPIIEEEDKGSVKDVLEEERTFIDYSGAVPEIHFVHKHQS